MAFYLPDLRMGAFERSELRYMLYVCMYVCIAVMVVVLVRDSLCVCRKHLLHEQRVRNLVLGHASRVGFHR